MRRLGPFSPLTTVAAFSPGAHTLLRQAERSGEIALHVVRGIWISIVFITAQQWSAAAQAAAVPGSAVIAGVWTLGLLGLVRSRTFTFARYALTAVDGWVVLGMVLVLYGPIHAARELVGPLGFAPSSEQLAGYVPPMLVYLALSGTLRLDPRPAVLSGGIAVAGAVFYVATIGLERGTGGLLIPLVVLSAIVAANGARIIRYMVLKATEGAIYESYVPESLSRDLAHHGVLERAGRVEDVTLLLCDIRGFTKLSERLSPSETVTLVNTYLDAVCPPIANAGGVIDKFMGDGVLAFFEGGGNATRAVGAARRILEAVERTQIAGTTVRVGIALHSGEVLVGTVGPRTRREYTIISDAVNTVSRLEELNKTYGSVIVASATTIAQVSHAERAGFEGPIEVSLRGREVAVAVHVLRRAA
ncbi:MAG: adenylate/guanylate cyclase domain-containing protein [Chloroflexi bacterium]|nr:adenylate/guanylate cyclase domain-containing protein [Chloroflexota bacterium]